MHCQKRTLALSYHVKAELDLVSFGIQQSSRNSIRHTRYPSRKIACNLEPMWIFPFAYFSCTLPDDAIDVDITACMPKGIHTFRKDKSMQVSKCSPWGMEVNPFPSLKRKMDYDCVCFSSCLY